MHTKQRSNVCAIYGFYVKLLNYNLLRLSQVIIYYGITKIISHFNLKMSLKLNIGIIGNGFVGKATQLLNCSAVQNLFVYDICPEKCEPIGLQIHDMAVCDLIFIALPTPMDGEGRCYLGLIESSLEQLRKYIDTNKTHFVLRSTVIPGTSDRLKVNFMPEFLTEKNWESDFVNCTDWIFGCDIDDINFQKKIGHLFQVAHSDEKIKHCNLHFVPKKEAELIKYIRNTFLATKVSFFNEIFEYTQKKGIDFDVVRHLATLDARIGSSHSAVPGHDSKRGFGGTCFPKDLSALVKDFEDNQIISHVLKNVLIRNEEVDRPEKDWCQSKGRAVLN